MYVRYTERVKPHLLVKHLFVPHHGNDYKPHFFRELGVGIVIFVSIFLLGFSAGSSFFIKKTVLGASIGASVLVDLTNQSRLAFNEQPLLRNEKLDAAAQMKGEDMVLGGYFAHESPTGVTPWHWFVEAGYKYLYAGENLAINFSDSEAVTQAWLNSPKHRENLLDVRFKEIGMAAVEGLYNGNKTIFIVQLFGTPARNIESVAPVVSTSTASSTPEEVIVPIDATTTESTTKESPAPSEVKGESVKATAASSTVAVSSQQATTTENRKVEEEVSNEVVPHYSTWYQKFIFDGPKYITGMYLVLIFVVLLGLITLVTVEVRKQHYKHILYGVGLLVMLAALIYINTALFS